MPPGLEWVVILVVIVLLFGAKKFPAIAKSLGNSVREFKKATSHTSDDIIKQKSDDIDHKSTDEEVKFSFGSLEEARRFAQKKIQISKNNGVN